MKYPESVKTKDRKGNEEVRVLVDKGKFVRYQYMNPKTGKIVENNKTSIIIKNKQGKEEHFYMIPIKGNKFLTIPLKEEKSRKVWNKKTKKEEQLFQPT